MAAGGSAFLDSVDVTLVPLVRPDPPGILRFGSTLSYAQLTLPMLDTSSLEALDPSVSPDLATVKAIASAPYDVRVADAKTGRELRVLSSPVEIGLVYHLDDLPRGASEGAIALNRWDEFTRQWVTLPTSVDSQQRIVHASLSVPGIVALTVAAPVAVPLADGSRQFPFLGRTVNPAFYERIAFGGGLARSGLPLSDSEANGAIQAQWFQKARIEYDTTTGEVRYGPIGAEYLASVGASFAPVADQGSTGDQRYFPESGQYVQFGFLAYYDQVDGPTSLGAPLSPELVENGRNVQYFSKGRLEWNAAASRVEVGKLGEDLRLRTLPQRR